MGFGCHGIGLFSFRVWGVRLIACRLFSVEWASLISFRGRLFTL